MKKLIYCLFFIISFYSNAQKGGLPLGDEYYQNSEYAKALTIYVNFIEDEKKLPFVYDKYLNCLTKLRKHEDSELFLKKLIKKYPNNLTYKTDLIQVYYLQGKNNDAQKVLDKFVKTCKDDAAQTPAIIEVLTKKSYFSTCKTIYLNERKSQRNDFIYCLEMAEIFKQEKNTPAMIQELIRVLMVNQNDKDFLKSRFQEYITTEEDFESFEKEVITRVQEEPTQYLYTDLLIWIHLQKKDFYRAFIQAKSYDKLTKMQGNKILEVGKIATENKDYETAIEIFDYLTREYKTSPVYPTARKLKIETKEIWVKNTFPIQTANIRTLIKDYENLATELGRTQETIETVRNRALLYAFYLNSKDTAIALLNETLKYPWIPREFASQCKLDLGDIYLLKNESWESTLLYSQVEKEQKETLIGHEAKLKNAKLSYYTGQFAYAQEHLDVLKLATTREIANDALDLSLFILDNTGLDDDSTHEALNQYAQAELLLFQNNFKAASQKLDSILLNFKDNSIEDEVCFLQAKVFRKTGEFQKAISKLESIGNKFKSDIYGDDAAFLYAEIFENDLKDKSKAEALYNKFIIDFPSSIYSAEARKRFRLLRGDVLN